jgi:nitrous oxidase accessory protein NosD
MLVATALAAGLLTLGGTQAVASSPPTLVVDDDGVQCAKADFASIQGAVNAAPPDALIRVCPGRYEESVTVSKALTLKGDPDAVEAVDCFEAALPDLPTDRYAIVDPPDDAAAAFALAADDIDLSGFVIEDRSLGITTSDSFSGYRLHHNLLAKNELGIEFDSGATEASQQESRFDHNCLRENTFGLTVGWLTPGAALEHATIDHNASFKTLARAFEAAPGRIENVTLKHNDSRLDDNAYLIWNSSNSKIIDNTLESVRIGIEVGSVIPNQDLEISRNVLNGPALTGIGFSTAASGDRSTRVLVAANTITGHNTGIAIGGPPGATTGSLTHSQFLGNVTNNNAQRGIRLRGGNEKLTFRGNRAESNGFYGIDAQCGEVSGQLVCPIKNLFEANTMLGNGYSLKGGVDARDQARDGNTWIGNECQTDDPVGTICGVGSTAADG